MKNDLIFAKCWKVATIQAILDYQETHFAILAKEYFQYQYNLPFQETVVQAIPTHKIRVDIKRIL